MYAQSALQLASRPRSGRSLSAQTTLAVALAGLLLAIFGALAGLAPTLSASIQRSIPVESAVSRATGAVIGGDPAGTDRGRAIAGAEDTATTVVYLPLAKRGGAGVAPRQKPVAPPARPQDPKQNVPILPALAVPLPVSQTEPPRVRAAANAQVARRIAAAVERPPSNVPPAEVYRSPVSPTGAGSAGQAVDPAAPTRAGPAGFFL